MTDRIYVLYAKPYSFVDEDTKQKRDGVSVNYLVTGDLKDPGQQPDQSLGYPVFKGSISLDSLNKLSTVPGWYDGEFVFVNTKSGQTAKLRDVKPVAQK